MSNKSNKSSKIKKTKKNKKSNICKYGDCEKSCSFNVMGHKPKFCASHKLPGMVDVDLIKLNTKTKKL